MATIDPADEAQLFATIDRWVEREVAPRVKEFDHADKWPAEIVEQMKELGLFGATVSPDYGGLGLPATTYAQIVMKVSAVWMAITGIFNSHLMLALAVEKFGTEPQRRHWLPKFASGEVRGGLALTEPNAGTDLQAIRMTARREGGDYVINGTKTWITNGVYGTCFAVLVKTDPEAKPAHRGMSLFLCEKGPGFTVGRKLKKLGYKSIDSAELVFDNFEVNASRLIGGEEGKGKRSDDYEARAARRVTMTVALTGLAIFARAACRVMLRTFTMKHFSSARSTRCSISSAFSRITSDTSEMMSALARSSIRFSRNERLFDLLRNVRLLRTSAMS